MKREDAQSSTFLVGEPVADADLAYVWGGAPADKLARMFPEQQRKTGLQGTKSHASGSQPVHADGLGAALRQVWDAIRS
ncbi:MAG: hypothetical protein RL685_7788 [Pseudomonadota bacterium]|jgi:hypothetical protein